MVDEEREACEKCAYNDEGACFCSERSSVCCPYAEAEEGALEEAAKGLMFTVDSSEEDTNKDIKFMTDTISEICKYAKDNGMKPDDTLRTFCENVLALLEISTFNNMK